MDTTLKHLRLRQMDERISPWRPLVQHVPPRGGWIKAIREALGISTSQLASRLGVTRQAVMDLERRERESTVTFAALRRAADAMDCDLLYAVVPRTPLRQMLWSRARAIAAKRLGKVAHSMQLEEQAVPSEEHDQQVEDLAAQIMRESPRELWSEWPA
jgi:predicted DNA-binding mobile mystery protein A